MSHESVMTKKDTLRAQFINKNKDYENSEIMFRHEEIKNISPQ